MLCGSGFRCSLEPTHERSSHRTPIIPADAVQTCATVALQRSTSHVNGMNPDHVCLWAAAVVMYVLVARLCMCTSMYVYRYVCMYVCMYVCCMYVSACFCTSRSGSVHIYIYAFDCLRIYTYAYTVYTCIHVYTYMRVYIYTHFI